MAQPSFHHIHCSSRYDRSPASLEADLDDWMARCSLITVTEVTNDQRAAKLAEPGWGYYNNSIGIDSDNCAIAWDKKVWKRTYGKVIRLSSNTFDRVNGMHNLYVYAATVVLTYIASGHELLVTVSHMPSHIEGPNGFQHGDAGWAARKNAFLTGLSHWSTHVKDVERKQKADASLIVADWNVNLKDQWVRNILNQHWGSDYHIAWQRLPTAGGALHGGPTAPAGAPGGNQGDRIIDGSVIKDLKTVSGPDLMARVKSSDHRPFTERFEFANKASLTEAQKKALRKDDTQDKDLQGDIKRGEEWWGFGDTLDDEIYFDPNQEVGTGAAGGEVL